MKQIPENPYATPKYIKETSSQPYRLKAFARGARNAVLWAILPMSMYAMELLNHGGVFRILFSVLPILALWICCAGLVAMRMDRKKLEMQTTLASSENDFQ